MIVDEALGKFVLQSYYYFYKEPINRLAPLLLGPNSGTGLDSSWKSMMS